MPWTGSGEFALVENFPADRDAGSPDYFIDADKVDNELQNIKGGLENCLTRSGETVPSANTPWNAKKITGLGDATNATDALNRQSGDARYALLSGNNTLVGNQTITGDVSITGGLTATGDPTVGDDVGNRDYNDARYLLVAGGSNIAGTFTLTGGVTFSCAGNDFALSSPSGGVSNFFWFDASAVALFLGSPAAVPTLREDLNANANTIYGPAAPTAGNHVGDRDYNDARYFNESSNLSEGAAATMRSNLDLGSIATADVTASTSAPSGGSNGDIWFRYQ